MAKILIVDDSRTSRKFLRDILEKSGNEIVGEAVNGREGFDLYQKLRPDIVTMDITMPVMDGLDSLKLIMRFDPAAKVEVDLATKIVTVESTATVDQITAALAEDGFPAQVQ